MRNVHHKTCIELLSEVEVKYILDFMTAYSDHAILPIIEEMVQACIQSNVDTNKAFDEEQAPIYELVNLHQFIFEAYEIKRNQTWYRYRDAPIFTLIDGQMRVSLPAVFVTRARPLNNSQWPETVLLRSWAMAESAIVEGRQAKLQVVLDLSLALAHWQRLMEQVQADLQTLTQSGKVESDWPVMEDIGAIPIHDLVHHPLLQPPLNRIFDFLSFTQLPDYTLRFAMIIQSSALRRGPNVKNNMEATLLSSLRALLSALHFVGLRPSNGAAPQNLRGAFDRGDPGEVETIVAFTKDFERQKFADTIQSVVLNLYNHRGDYESLDNAIERHMLYSLRDAVFAFMDIFHDAVLAIAENRKLRQ